MITSYGLILAFVFVADRPVRTTFVQVAPALRNATVVERSPGQKRAVVLIHGLQPHLFSTRKIAEPDSQSWQEPGSRLVDLLAEQADVFAFAYTQNASVERIAGTFGLRRGVGQLRRAGYQEIVLVGHSAGGLVVRQFVEDHPDSGVTKVIQICTPNCGASLAGMELTVRKGQEAFLDSLTKKCRHDCLTKRAGKEIPKHVEFACLVGQLHLDASAEYTRKFSGKDEALTLGVDLHKRGDGVVSCDSQWPTDLQVQGVPMITLGRDHLSMVRGRAGTAAIAKLVREPQRRWNEDQVKAARMKMLGR